MRRPLWRRSVCRLFGLVTCSAAGIGMLPGAPSRCRVSLPLDAIEFCYSRGVIYIVTNG